MCTWKCKISFKNIDYKYNCFTKVCILGEMGIKPLLILVEKSDGKNGNFKY